MAGISDILVLVVQARVTAQDTTIKEFQCEQCAFKYVYRLVRAAEGKATSFIIPNKDAAAKKANDKLKRMLRTDCDPVPCPACGWYQGPMVRLLKQQRFRGLVWAGQFVFVLSVVLGGLGLLVAVLGSDFVDPHWPSASVLYGLAGVALALGICLSATKYVLGWWHNPNDQDMAVRTQRGQALACSKEDYDAGKAIPSG